MTEILEEIRKLNSQIKDLNLNMNSKFEETNSKIEHKFDYIEKELLQINEKVDNFEARISSLEVEKRKRNVVIFGLPEKENNTRELENVITDIIKQKMKVEFNVDDIDFIYRLGKINNKHPRPIILGFVSLRKKMIILENKMKLRNLQDCKIFMVSDLPKDVIEKNKKLKKARDYLQLKNIDAKIIKGKLMVNDTELNEDQVDKTIEEGNDTKKRHRSSDDEDNIDKTKSTKIIKPATLTMAARTKDSTGSGPSTPTAITKFFSLASK